MADKKKSFILYADWRDIIQELNIMQRGILLSAIFDKVNGVPPTNMDDVTKICFKVIWSQICRDAEHWETIRQKRCKAGEKSAEARKNSKATNLTNVNFVEQNATNLTVTDTDTDTDTVSDTVSVPVIYTPPTPSQEGAEARFEEFWKEYPRKVGKQAAKKAYLKLKPTQALSKQIIEAIRVQKNSRAWLKDNGQYIPNPTTWINQGRWEDEITETQSETWDSLDELFASQGLY